MTTTLHELAKMYEHYVADTMGHTPPAIRDAHVWALRYVDELQEFARTKGHTITVTISQNSEGEKA